MPQKIQLQTCIGSISSSFILSFHTLRDIKKIIASMPSNILNGISLLRHGWHFDSASSFIIRSPIHWHVFLESASQPDQRHNATNLLAQALPWRQVRSGKAKQVLGDRSGRSMSALHAHSLYYTSIAKTLMLCMSHAAVFVDASESWWNAVVSINTENSGNNL